MREITKAGWTLLANPSPCCRRTPCFWLPSPTCRPGSYKMTLPSPADAMRWDISSGSPVHGPWRKTTGPAWNAASRPQPTLRLGARNYIRVCWSRLPNRAAAC